MKPKTRLSCPPWFFLLPFPPPLSPLPRLVGIHEQWKRRSKSRSPATQHANFLPHLSPPSFLSLPLFVFSEFACETSSPIFPCVCVCPVWLPAAHHFLSEQDGPRMPASSWLCDILSAFSAPLPRCSSARLLLCCDCRRGWEKVVSSTRHRLAKEENTYLGLGQLASVGLLSQPALVCSRRN